MLRPAAPEDRALLCVIYGSSREEELARTNWNEAMKAAFIQDQFTAQYAYYQEVYPDSDYSVILSDQVPAGRLYVERHLIPGTIRIIDITLLPSFRNMGIGGFLLRRLQEEAAAAGKTLTIHVEKFNRALEFYTRLGFIIIKETHGVYLLMEWRPERNLP